jgi:hypothetical protein
MFAMRIWETTLAIMFMGICCFCQDQWIRVEQTDALRGTSYSQFTLRGRFLTAPRQASPNPEFIVSCSAGERNRGVSWQKNGKFDDAHITVGAVVEARANGTPVQYRLDDGKIHTELWNQSTDGTSIFLAEAEFNTLLYGHFMPHREGTGEPVHKVVISVNEYLGAAIVMEFDLPATSSLADACGAILHKRRH